MKQTIVKIRSFVTSQLFPLPSDLCESMWPSKGSGCGVC